MTIKELNEGLIAKIASLFKNINIKLNINSTEHFKIDSDTECKVMIIRNNKLAYICKNFEKNKEENIHNFDISVLLKKLSKQIYELLIDKNELNYDTVEFNKLEPLFTTNDKPIGFGDPLRKLILIGDLIGKNDKLKNAVKVEIKFNKCGNDKCEIYYEIKIDLGLKKINSKKFRLILPKKISYNY
jgi:hypothetical protein